MQNQRIRWSQYLQREDRQSPQHWRRKYVDRYLLRALFPPKTRIRSAALPLPRYQQETSAEQSETIPKSSEVTVIPPSTSSTFSGAKSTSSSCTMLQISDRTRSQYIDTYRMRLRFEILEPLAFSPAVICSMVWSLLRPDRCPAACEAFPERHLSQIRTHVADRPT